MVVWVGTNFIWQTRRSVVSGCPACAGPNMGFWSNCWSEWCLSCPDLNFHASSGYRYLDCSIFSSCANKFHRIQMKIMLCLNLRRTLGFPPITDDSHLELNFTLNGSESIIVRAALFQSFCSNICLFIRCDQKCSGKYKISFLHVFLMFCQSFSLISSVILAIISVLSQIEFVFFSEIEDLS